MSIEAESSTQLDRRRLADRRSTGGPLAHPPARATRIVLGFTKLASDLLAVSVAALAAGELVTAFGLSGAFSNPRVLPAVALPMLFALGLLGTYARGGLMAHEELQRLVLAVSSGFVPSALVMVLLMQAPPIGLLTWWSLTVTLVVLGRWSTRRLAQRLRGARIPAVVLSDETFGAATISLLRESVRSDYWPTVLHLFGPNQEDAAVLGPRGPVSSQLAGDRSGVAILSFPGVDLSQIKELTEQYCSGFTRALSLPAIPANSELWYERVERLPDNTRLSLWTQVAKRAFDLVVSSTLLIVLVPILILIGIAIRIDSKGPILYSQRRIGRNGESFEMLKFRTMEPDAESRLAEHLRSDIAVRREWDLYQKLAEDPRVTRVGSVLRKLSLDELPQVLNVLAGHMSLVGPRPMFAGQEQPYGDAIELYTQVRPGLTGLWQISGRNRITFQDRAWLDAFYVRNLSLWLDSYILLKTPLAVLQGEGRADQQAK